MNSLSTFHEMHRSPKQATVYNRATRVRVPSSARALEPKRSRIATARLHTWSDQTRSQEPNEPDPVGLPSSFQSSCLELPSRAAATWRRPATCPMMRRGRCGAASSRRFLRLLPPPARSPGIASPPSLLPAPRSTDSPIRSVS